MGSAHVKFNLCNDLNCVWFLGDCAVVSIYFQRMVGYTNTELNGMKTYIEYLSRRPRRLGRRPASYREMPDAWREFLRLNSGDQYALGLFVFYVYVVGFWNK